MDLSTDSKTKPHKILLKKLINYDIFAGGAGADKTNIPLKTTLSPEFSIVEKQKIISDNIIKAVYGLNKKNDNINNKKILNWHENRYRKT